VLGQEEIDMDKLPKRLQIALESDCAEELNEVIRAHQEADFERLRQLLTSKPQVDPRLRNRAMYALGRWGDARAVGDILQVMPDLDERGRIAAMDSLGRLGSNQALQAIMMHSDDPSPHVRKFAIHALGRFQLPEARAKLIEIRDKDPDEHLRNLATDYINRDQSE
jgi:HEAT repeat protein